MPRSVNERGAGRRATPRERGKLSATTLSSLSLSGRDFAMQVSLRSHSSISARGFNQELDSLYLFPSNSRRRFFFNYT